MEIASNQGFLSEILADTLTKFFLRLQLGFSLFISSLIPSLFHSPTSRGNMPATSVNIYTQRRNAIAPTEIQQ